MRVQIPPCPPGRFAASAVLALVAAVQLRALPGDYLGAEHDDAHYVLASHALLRGHYRLGISPGDPPLTFITPGWPLLLAPVTALTGGSHAGYRLYAWLWLVLCDVLVLLWLRKRLGGLGALSCAALFGLCPLVLARAGKVMTEIPALALTLGLFILLDRARWPAWGSGGLLGFLWLARQPSVALLPPLAAWYMRVKRDRRGVAAVAAGLAAAMAGWSLWLAKTGGRMSEFDELRQSYGSLRAVAGAAASNAGYYASLWGRLWLPCAPREDALEFAVGVALLGLAAWGAARILRRRPWEPSVVWLACGAPMHLFWPYRYERYLLSFLPALVWTLWEGAGAALPSRAARTAVLACVLAGQFLGQGRLVLASAEARSVPRLLGTYAWIRENVPAHEAVSSLFYSRDALYTGRPSAPLPEPASAGELLRWLQAHGVGYILLEEERDMGSALGTRFAPGEGPERLRRILDEPPFLRLYGDPAERTVLYKLERKFTLYGPPRRGHAQNHGAPQLDKRSSRGYTERRSHGLAERAE